MVFALDLIHNPSEPFLERVLLVSTTPAFAPSDILDSRKNIIRNPKLWLILCQCGLWKIYQALLLFMELRNKYVWTLENSFVSILVSTPDNNSKWVNAAIAVEWGQGEKGTNPLKLRKWVISQSIDQVQCKPRMGKI